MQSTATYRRGRLMAYSRITGITNVASNATVPRPAGVATYISPLVVLLEAPSTNTDSVRFAITGTATAADRPLVTGTSLETPLGRNSTISVIADTGTQVLDITAFYA